VVGEGPDLSPRCAEPEGLKESPRAGRSMRWLELNDDPDAVSGDSRVPIGGDDVKVGSTIGLLSLEDISAPGEPWRAGVSLLSEDLRLASAFLFLGTSCSLNASVAEGGAGEACWLRDLSFSDGDSLEVSRCFLSVLTIWSDGCLPFSWNAICGLPAAGRSADPDLELFSFNLSRGSAVGLLK